MIRDIYCLQFDITGTVLTNKCFDDNLHPNIAKISTDDVEIKPIRAPSESGDDRTCGNVDGQNDHRGRGQRR